MAKIATEEFYDEYPYKIHGNYYIHWRMSNIGRLKNGSMKDLSAVFNESKVQQSINIAKNQYRDLLNNNLHQISKNKINEHSNVLELMLQNGKQTNDQLLSQFNQIIGEELQKRVNEKAITTALNTSKGLSLSTSGQSIFEDLNATCKQVNDILQTIEKVINKFKKDTSADGIAFLLFNVEDLRGGNNRIKIKNMGIDLDDQIDQIETALQGKLFPFNGSQQAAIISGIRQLSAALKRGVKKSNNKEDLTLNSLKHIFDQNIFSTGIGEAIGMKAQKVMKSALKNTLNGLELKGQGTVAFIPSDENGVFQEVDDSSKANFKMGKVDIKYSNVTLHLDETSLGPDGGTLRLNIGISNKLYQSNNFRYSNLTGSGAFGFGGGLTLRQLIDMISSEDKVKYLAYNAFSWSRTSTISKTVGYKNLSRIMQIRSVLNLVSTRGGYQDFAMFMLLNGKIVSIWDILLYVIEHSTSKESKAINIYISGKDYLSPVKHSRKITMNNRIQLLNNAFDKAGITGNIKPGQLYKEGIIT